MLIFNLHSQLVLRISDITKISYIKTRLNVKSSLYLKKAGLASRKIVRLKKKSSYVVSVSTFIFLFLAAFCVSRVTCLQITVESRFFEPSFFRTFR